MLRRMVRIANGLGKHQTVTPLNEIKNARKIIYIVILIWNAAVAVPKLSALCFYQRVFHQTYRWFSVLLWSIGILNVLWFLAAELSTIFQCSPVKAAYEIVEGRCIPEWKWQLATTIPSVVIDVMILFLPLPLLARLQVPLRRKLLLIGVFIFGYR